MTIPSAPLASIPREPVRVPERVALLAAGRKVSAVWLNGLGGLTFRDSGPTHGPEQGARFIKWVAAGTPELDLAAEAGRLRWAAGEGARVPRVIEHGADASGAWLVTQALAGDSAVAKQWIGDPRRAALAIGAGLRELHSTLPTATCPFQWDTAGRIAQFERRLEAGTTPASWSAEYRHLTVAVARELLHAAPPVDQLVVAHGDACAPNTLIHADGSFAAHVDLGELGVADRWADLAVAAWSTEWNYGPGFTHLVYEGYGVRPDPERIAYYRLLWDLS